MKPLENPWKEDIGNLLTVLTKSADGCSSETKVLSAPEVIFQEFVTTISNLGQESVTLVYLQVYMFEVILARSTLNGWLLSVEVFFVVF